MNYNSNNKIAHLKSKLSSLIERTADDNLKTHLRQIFLFDNEAKLLGNISQTGFRVWIHEQGRSGVTGAFYPVVHGHFSLSTRGVQVSLRSKMNIVGKIIVLVVASLISYGLLTNIILQNDNSIKYLIPRIFVSMVILTLMMSVPLFIHFRTSRIVKRYLVSELGLEATHIQQFGN